MAKVSPTLVTFSKTKTRFLRKKIIIIANVVVIPSMMTY